MILELEEFVTYNRDATIRSCSDRLSFSLLHTSSYSSTLTMHSYNREWDRGKEWEEYSHKNRARSRGDEETQYDDKRRKYHNAVRSRRHR